MNLRELAALIEKSSLDAITGSGEPCINCEILTPVTNVAVRVFVPGRRSGWRDRFCVICQLEASGLIHELIRMILPDEAFLNETHGIPAYPRAMSGEWTMDIPSPPMGSDFHGFSTAGDKAHREYVAKKAVATSSERGVKHDRRERPPKERRSANAERTKAALGKRPRLRRLSRDSAPHSL